MIIHYPIFFIELQVKKNLQAFLLGKSVSGRIRKILWLLWKEMRQPASYLISFIFGGNSVDAVAFLPSPRGTDGHVLLTGVTRNTKTLFLVTGSVIGFAAVEYQSSEIEMFLH
jgi:hypothetical protein